MPKVSLSRWRRMRRCSGPCAPTSAAPVTGSFATVSAPSPSPSEASAPESLTLSRSATGARTRCIIAGWARCHAGGSSSASVVAMTARGEVVGLDRADDHARRHLVEVAGVARVGRGQLAGGPAAELAARPERFERAQQQGLADVLAIGAGEDHGGRRFGEPGLGLEPFAQRGRGGGLMAQRLHHPDDAVAVAGRADQRLERAVLVQETGADLVDLGARRFAVLDQLFEQVVVELGQVLEHRGTRLVLAVERPRRDLDELRGSALAVAPGPVRRRGRRRR